MNQQVTHILLVEDEEAHAELVRLAFEARHERFHLTVAGSVAEARGCLAEAVPHLIITDLRLPDGLGTGLLPAEGEKHTFPLIVMTAQGDQAAAVEAMKAGALDYLVKSREVLVDTPHISERILREWHSITERRAAEEKLRQYRERLEELVEERTVEVNKVMAELVEANEVMNLVDEVAQIITSTLDIGQVYEKFALELKKLVDFDRMNINLIDHEAGVFTVKYLVGEDFTGQQPGRARPLAESRTQHVIETGRTLVRADLAEESRFPADLENVKAGLRSGILVPLISKGEFFGVLSLRSCRPSVYGPKEQAILERLANQIAPAIENSQLYLRLQASTEEMALADEVARIITSTLEIDQVYERFALELKKLVDFDVMNINIIDTEAGDFTTKYLVGGSLPEQQIGDTKPLEGTRSQHVIETRQTLVRTDTAVDKNFPNELSDAAAGLRSSIALPWKTPGCTRKLRRKRNALLPPWPNWKRY